MAIEWNKVTWYSKLIAVVLFVSVFYLGFYLGQEKKEIEKFASENSDRCFVYSHAATATEPYNVKENVSLNISGEKVSGTKDGTQSGPDMTNGYQGSLSGTLKDGIMEVVFSYTIEGSQNKELEVYELKNKTLNKMRWPLKEESGMLVPDKAGQHKIIPYEEKECSQESSVI